MKMWAIKLDGGKWLGHWSGNRSSVPFVSSLTAARVYSSAMFALLAVVDIKLSRGLYATAVEVEL